MFVFICQTIPLQRQCPMASHRANCHLCLRLLSTPGHCLRNAAQSPSSLYTRPPLSCVFLCTASRWTTAVPPAIKQPTLLRSRLKFLAPKVMLPLSSSPAMFKNCGLLWATLAIKAPPPKSPLAQPRLLLLKRRQHPPPPETSSTARSFHLPISWWFGCWKKGQ